MVKASELCSPPLSSDNGSLLGLLQLLVQHGYLGESKAGTVVSTTNQLLLFNSYVGVVIHHVITKWTMTRKCKSRSRTDCRIALTGRDSTTNQVKLSALSQHDKASIVKPAILQKSENVCTAEFHTSHSTQTKLFAFWERIHSFTEKAR